MGIAESLFLVICVFCCVILHELGHALMARKFGIGTRDIVMYPVGGVASLNGIPRNPWEELAVAVAGPAVNVLIALLIAAGLLASGTPLLNDHFINNLLFINIFLVVFNMIPAFPMDGGRALRAIIALWQTRVRATYIAMWVGRVFASAFVIFGLFGGIIITYLTGEKTEYTNPFLALIGVFVMMGARREYDYEIRRESAEKLTLPLHNQIVKTYMRREYTVFMETDPLLAAVELAQRGLEKHFLVTDAQREIVGILTYDALLEASKTNHLRQPISAFIQRNFQSFSPDDNAETAYYIFQDLDLPLLPVVSDAQVIGVLDLKILYRIISNS